MTDETEDVLEHIEKNRDLWLKDECIRFIVRHMCENFIIVNPETDEATTFVHDHRQMQPKSSWKEQIRWFADNIVVPEEREDYEAYFDLDALGFPHPGKWYLQGALYRQLFRWASRLHDYKCPDQGPGSRRGKILCFLQCAGYYPPETCQ